MGIQDAIMREMDAEEYNTEMTMAEVRAELVALQERISYAIQSIDNGVDADSLRHELEFDSGDVQYVIELLEALPSSEFGDDRIPTNEELDIMDQM